MVYLKGGRQSLVILEGKARKSLVILESPEAHMLLARRPEFSLRVFQRERLNLRRAAQGSSGMGRGGGHVQSRERRARGGGPICRARADLLDVLRSVLDIF